MNLIKNLFFAVLLIALTKSDLNGQFKFFKYGFLEYHEIKWMTERFVPHGILNHNFKHRLVIPNFVNDTLVLLHQNNTLYLVQNLGEDDYLEDTFYPENTFINVFVNERKSSIIRRMKIVEFLDSTILFKARIKKSGEKAEWINFELDKSDLSGIYIGNSFTDMPLVIAGSLIGIMVFAIIDDFLEDDS